MHTLLVVLGTGTRVPGSLPVTRVPGQDPGTYPGTRSGPGYPGIFITRLLNTQHCRLDCEFVVIHNNHKSTANLRANCKYNSTALHVTDYL